MPLELALINICALGSCRRPLRDMECDDVAVEAGSGLTEPGFKSFRMPSDKQSVLFAANAFQRMHLILYQHFHKFSHWVPYLIRKRTCKKIVHWFCIWVLLKVILNNTALTLQLLFFYFTHTFYKSGMPLDGHVTTVLGP